MDGAYTPRPGSKGDAALQHLQVNGRTSHIDLADVVDCPSSNLQNNIALCLAHGLIKKLKLSDGLFYDLGDGTPPAADQEPMPPQQASTEAAQVEGKAVKGDHAEKRSAPRRKVQAPRTVGKKPKGKVPRKPRAAPMPPSAPPATTKALVSEPPPQSPQREPGTFAFISDGTLEIYGAGGAVTVLTTAKLRAMADLFGRA